VRSGYFAEAHAAAVLAQPLRLRNGSVLAPIVDIDLSPAPAFVWWQLALGAILTLIGSLSLIASTGGASAEHSREWRSNWSC
jgi:hypothetical protein